MDSNILTRKVKHLCESGALIFNGHVHIGINQLSFTPIIKLGRYITITFYITPIVFG